MRYDDALFVSASAAWLPRQRARAVDAVGRGEYSQDDLVDSQYESVAVSGDDSPPVMAARAAASALSRSSHNRDALGLVLHASAHHQGHDFWSAASFIQDQIAARSAWCLNINQMCNGGLAGLELASAFILASPEREAALVTTADRFSLPRFDRWRSDYGIVYGDGATAVVLSRVAGIARVVSSNTVTEARLEAMHRGDDPFSLGPGDSERPIDIRRTKKAFLARHGSELVARYSETALKRVVADTLAEGDVGLADIRWCVLPNLGRKLLGNLYAKACPVGFDRTLWQFGRTVGHLGAGDMALGLTHLLEERRVGTGDFCLLVGAGGGYSWTATLVEIADAPYW